MRGGFLERPRAEDAQEPEHQDDQQDGSDRDPVPPISRLRYAAAEAQDDQNNQDDEENWHSGIVRCFWVLGNCRKLKYSRGGMRGKILADEATAPHRARRRNVAVVGDVRLDCGALGSVGSGHGAVAAVGAHPASGRWAVPLLPGEL
jgi:hypothetical protein